MKPYDCVLIRIGETALKSNQVRKRFFKILLLNIKDLFKGIEYKTEKNPNRLFIYSSEIRKVMSRLKKVFGIVSISPCWTCYSGINEIKLLVSDVAVEQLSKESSFAIRVRRAGIHTFSSQTIAEEAGAAVKRVTGSKVDLTNPDMEIFIEVRSKKAYVFIDKIKCLGGMPVGTAGSVVCPIESVRSFAAAWLMMKRGCEIIAVVRDDMNKDANMKAIKKLKKFDARIKVYADESGNRILNICDSLCDEAGASGIAVADNFETAKVSDMTAGKNPVYRPLFFLDSKNIEKISKKFS